MECKYDCSVFYEGARTFEVPHCCRGNRIDCVPPPDMLPPLQCSVALQCAHVPLANRRQLTLNRIKVNSLDHVKVTAVDRVKVKSFLERMEIRKKQSYRINASIEKSRDSSGNCFSHLFKSSVSEIKNIFCVKYFWLVIYYFNGKEVYSNI